MTRINALMTTTRRCSRPTKTRWLPQLVAGDGDHAGADQGPKRDHNIHAHTLVAVVTTEEDHNDD